RNIILTTFRFSAFSHSLGHKRPICDVRFMSAFHPIATEWRTSRHFGFGPKADMDQISPLEL
ncbi:MAG: hypothetical protein WBF27_14585, partial [Xanthobacteraceae bacterium]